VVGGDLLGHEDLGVQPRDEDLLLVGVVVVDVVGERREPLRDVLHVPVLLDVHALQGAAEHGHVQAHGVVGEEHAVAGGDVCSATKARGMILGGATLGHVAAVPARSAWTYTRHAIRW